MTEKKWSIWDLDNCLADDAWRQPMIDFTKEGGQRYEVYDAAMFNDRPAHVEEFNFMRRFTTPVVFTGRREKWRQLTERWLDKHFGFVPMVFMRGDDDNGVPVQVKRDMLLRLLNDQRVPVFDIVGAFDDLPAVVQMYRQFSIPSCELAIHGDLLAAYTPADLQPTA